MTTLLTSKQADALRSIGDSAMVLFALWMIDLNYPGRMTTAEELKPYLYPHIKDKRKIEAQLNALCASGRLTQTSAGYVLLEGGRALLLGMMESQLHGNKDLALSSPAFAIAGTITDQARNEVIDVNVGDIDEVCARISRADSLKKIEEDSFNFKNSSSSDSDLKSAQNLRIGNEIFHTAATLKAGESAVIPQVTGYTFEDGTPIYLMDRGDGVLINTRQILDATQEIEGFGDIGARLNVDAIKPELALAWVAKAFDDRIRLDRAPAGLVVSRLRETQPSQPPRKYFKNPAQFLPDEYCAELGLIKYDCRSCIDAKFSTRGALDEHVQKMHVQPEEKFSETVVAMIDPLAVDDKASLAWTSTLDNLQLEMPRASFDTWVRDTRAVDYDGRILTVGVRNQYCRDWLESRLTSRVQALLIVCLGPDVTVRFVVANVQEK